MGQEKSNAAAAPLPCGGMEAPPDSAPCPACGYPAPAPGCRRCDGQILDGPRGRPVRPGRGVAPLAMAHGVREFFRAAIHLLTRPEYFGRLAVPVAANVAAMALTAAVLWLGVRNGLGWLLAHEWAAGSLGAGAFSPAIRVDVLTAVTAAMLGPAILQTVTMPLLDPLADAVEKMLGGTAMNAVTRNHWKSLAGNLRSSAQVLAMQLVALGPCLLVSLWYAGAVLALLIAAFLNALLWFEIPFERRGYNLDQRIHIVRHNWARALGFGIGFQIGMAVPFFNLLLLTPTAAVAISMLYMHLEK